MKTVYGVYCNVDTNEGRGPIVLKYLLENKKDAQKIADELEPYKHSGQFNNVQELDLFNNYEEYSGIAGEQGKNAYEEILKSPDVKKFIRLQKIYG